MLKFVELLVQLAWPVLIGVLVYQFRRPILAILTAIPEALKRVQSLDAFGVKANLEKQEQVVINATAEAVAESVRFGLEATIQANAELPQSVGDGAVAQSPAVDRRARIVELSAQIERELRILAEAHGVSRVSKSIGSLLSQTPLREKLSISLVTSLRAFIGLRNEVVHNWESADVSVEAIQSGEELLGLLRQIPRAQSTVLMSLPIYSDPTCTVPYDSIHGIIVENRGMDGVPAVPVVYPTVVDYRDGDRIQIAWDMSKVVGPVYYKDPFTHDTIRSAYSSAACVNGKVLGEL